jgi:hypothetical protein
MARANLYLGELEMRQIARAALLLLVLTLPGCLVVSCGG